MYAVRGPHPRASAMEAFNTPCLMDAPRALRSERGTQAWCSVAGADHARRASCSIVVCVALASPRFIFACALHMRAVASQATVDGPDPRARTARCAHHGACIRQRCRTPAVGGNAASQRDMTRGASCVGALVLLSRCKGASLHLQQSTCLERVVNELQSRPRAYAHDRVWTHSESFGRHAVCSPHAAAGSTSHEARALRPPCALLALPCASFCALCASQMPSTLIAQLAGRVLRSPRNPRLMHCFCMCCALQQDGCFCIVAAANTSQPRFAGLSWTVPRLASCLAGHSRRRP